MRSLSHDITARAHKDPLPILPSEQTLNIVNKSLLGQFRSACDKRDLYLVEFLDNRFRLYCIGKYSRNTDYITFATGIVPLN